MVKMLPKNNLKIKKWAYIVESCIDWWERGTRTLDPRIMKNRRNLLFVIDIVLISFKNH